MFVKLLQPTNQNNSCGAFSKSLEDWQYPPDSYCWQTFARQQTDGIPFYEDITLYENGDAHNSWHAEGTRVSGPETFFLC